MENGRVRISDIAEELGLSTATVSNVLHGKTKKISDETVKRVQALLEEREYIPSMAGILLAQNSSRIIGVIINDHEKYEDHTLEDSYVSSSLNYLSTEIEKNGLFMMVKKTTSQDDIIRFASMWNLDGMVLMGFCDQDYMYLRERMRIPFVVYDGYCCKTDRIFNITIDNYDGGYQVGCLFRKLGHKKVLCISDNDICVDKDRHEGFCTGFGKENADFWMIPMQKEERMKFYGSRIAELKRYSAVFAVSDYYAVELVRFLSGQGVAVPKDISVAGFDDTPICGMISPTLTSVRQDLRMRAQIAMEKLKELRDSKGDNGSIDSEDKKCNTDCGNKKTAGAEIMLPVTLVERESTGPVRE